MARRRSDAPAPLPPAHVAFATMPLPPSEPHPGPSSWRDRLDPAWTPEWIRRTLTDEPGPGMGAPFSDADAARFLLACGLARPGRTGARPPDVSVTDGGAAERALFERMCRWLLDQASRP